MGYDKVVFGAGMKLTIFLGMSEFSDVISLESTLVPSKVTLLV